MWQFGMRSLFWGTTVLAVFLAAWVSLPVESQYRRFWFSWALVCAVVAVSRLCSWLVWRPK